MALVRTFVSTVAPFILLGVASSDLGCKAKPVLQKEQALRF
jgi:hypothetical protein